MKRRITVIVVLIMVAVGAVFAEISRENKQAEANAVKPLGSPAPTHSTMSGWD